MRAAGRAAIRLRRLATGALVAVWTAGVALHVLDRSFPLPDPSTWGGAPSSVVRAADGSVMHVGLDGRGDRRLPASAAPVSRHLVDALVASEDRRFFEHGGVDLRALARAAWRDVAAGAAVEGGSTITMQLARLADPEPRTIFGKVAQAFRALQIERRMGKEEIAARYLALAPFGGNLRGAEATALAWFGKRAADLAPEEAALMVSVLPAPGRRAPRRDEALARRNRDRVLDRMHEEGRLSDDAWSAACTRPLGLVAPSWPDRAPHAWMRAQAGETTIDPTLQRAVEGVALRAGAPDGLAIVVLDNATGGVRAIVGDAHPDATRLDATSRPRSAGSTLKPFLYALAFDGGLAVPTTSLLDLPWACAEWAPTDFDPVTRGPVAARTALADSLNLPAVRLAAALPAGAFADLLRHLGLSHVRDAAAGPAIDLALGTDDVTPLELAGACATLARGGRRIVPTLSAAGASSARDGDRILSEGACALVTEALADPARSRPGGAPASGVAWKTGTSSRRRDAWAAGWTTRVTVVVWRGRLDGAPDASLVGARAATPVLFEALGAADPAPAPFPACPDLEPVTVCQDSGLAPGPACGHTRADLRPRGAAPLAACDLHVRLETDAETGWIVCPRCAAGRQTDTLDALLASPALAAWRAAAGLPVALLAPHDPSCSAPLEPRSAPPAFASPRGGQRFLAGAGGTTAVVVRALAANPRDSLSLWLDGVAAGRSPSGAALSVPATAGRHVLVAVDGRGRRAEVAFEVASAP